MPCTYIGGIQLKALDANEHSGFKHLLSVQIKTPYCNNDEIREWVSIMTAHDGGGKNRIICGRTLTQAIMHIASYWNLRLCYLHVRQLVQLCLSFACKKL
jgi:hypothetical protein